ncbi:hypothetical protein U9M48_023759 [Paspalum notatum var. saurae]|uniref:Uncharacterized protein n=1 Tax=Paspalum notatum var. saurae TaxID=547442 RepID=A0AAQ3TQ22_PASNO
MCVMASAGFTNYTAFCLPTGTVAAVENVEAGNETVDLFPQNIGLCFASDEVLAWENMTLPHRIDPTSFSSIEEWWGETEAVFPKDRRRMYNGVVIYTCGTSGRSAAIESLSIARFLRSKLLGDNKDII